MDLNKRTTRNFRKGYTYIHTYIYGVCVNTDTNKPKKLAQANMKNNLKSLKIGILGRKKLALRRSH